MGLYKLPKIIGKNNKPPFGARINWHHPLSQGLVGAWLFNEGGGSNGYNLVDGTGGTLENNAFWTPNELDIGTITQSANLNAGMDKKFRFTDGNFTITAKLFIDQTNDAQTLCTFVCKLDGYYSGYTVYIMPTGQIILKISIAEGTSRQAYTSAGAIPAFNNYATISAVRNGSSGIIYLNGKDVTFASDTFGTIVWVYDTYPLRFGEYYGGNAGYNFIGRIVYAFIHNRALSNAEIASIYADPYKMILHPVWDAYIVPAAAPPPTGGRSIFGYDSIFHAGGIIQT